MGANVATLAPMGLLCSKGAFPRLSLRPSLPVLWVPGVLALLAALALGGCTATPKVVQSVPPPAPVLERVDCLAPGQNQLANDKGATSAPRLGSVPAGFVPVDVVRCVRDHFAIPEASGQARMVLREEHLAGNYQPLLDALAQPSDKAQGDIACTADAELLPTLWLVNAGGGAVHVRFPTDVCGKAYGKAGTFEALDSLAISRATELGVPLP